MSDLSNVMRGTTTRYPRRCWPILEAFIKHMRRKQREKPEEVPQAQETRANYILKERDVLMEFPWSRGLLRKWRIRGGGVPFIRINRQVFYRREAIEKFLIEHEIRV